MLSSYKTRPITLGYQCLQDTMQAMVVTFTPSAGVLEWVNGTLLLGENLIGSTRNGGSHGRYGKGGWTFPKCREHMTKVRTI
ncbi:hypothetical protein RHGRI_020989 [Rhododendron griersonianum]|uniref:Aldehyde dehydrogenase domain-containing protein n=1 Tax=Rhododendron griersonianum TaxID=479676 RepID=A0AAV6JNR8_9ERIC|nr:hypothetical protein RHGRI_020989 [Rhododendron griersonianum]